MKKLHIVKDVKKMTFISIMAFTVLFANGDIKILRPKKITGDADL